MEFRSSPSAYMQNRRTSPEALVASMTQASVAMWPLLLYDDVVVITMQVLASEQEKKEQPKLNILSVWQEMVRAKCL